MMPFIRGYETTGKKWEVKAGSEMVVLRQMQFIANDITKKKMTRMVDPEKTKIPKNIVMVRTIAIRNDSAENVTLCGHNTLVDGKTNLTPESRANIMGYNVEILKDVFFKNFVKFGQGDTVDGYLGDGIPYQLHRLVVPVSLQILPADSPEKELTVIFELRVTKAYVEAWEKENARKMDVGDAVDAVASELWKYKVEPELRIQLLEKLLAGSLKEWVDE